MYSYKRANSVVCLYFVYLVCSLPCSSITTPLLSAAHSLYKGWFGLPHAKDCVVCSEPHPRGGKTQFSHKQQAVGRIDGTDERNEVRVLTHTAPQTSPSDLQPRSRQLSACAPPWRNMYTFRAGYIDRQLKRLKSYLYEWNIKERKKSVGVEEISKIHLYKSTEQLNQIIKCLNKIY